MASHARRTRAGPLTTEETTTFTIEDLRRLRKAMGRFNTVPDWVYIWLPKGGRMRKDPDAPWRKIRNKRICARFVKLRAGKNPRHAAVAIANEKGLHPSMVRRILKAGGVWDR